MAISRGGGARLLSALGTVAVGLVVLLFLAWWLRLVGATARDGPVRRSLGSLAAGAAVDAGARVSTPAGQEAEGGLVLFHSIGGVGSSKLMLHCHEALVGHGLRVNSVVDRDHLKHHSLEHTLALLAARPPANAPPVVTAVYLFDDPVHAVMSLFRRGYFPAQMRKLQADRVADPAAPAAGAALLPMPLENMTVAAYAGERADLLGFEADFVSWFRGVCAGRAPFPVVFARRSALWRRMPDFARAVPVELARLAAEEQTPHVSRHTYREVPLPVLRALDGTYARLNAWYQLLGDYAHVPVGAAACAQRRNLRALSEALDQFEHERQEATDAGSAA